MTDLLLSF